VITGFTDTEPIVGFCKHANIRTERLHILCLESMCKTHRDLRRKRWYENE